MEQLVARKAHNLEVVRSSRAPATKILIKLTWFKSGFFYKKNKKLGILKKFIYLCKTKDGPIVYRLGRQVFILEIGVRFPVGLQNLLEGGRVVKCGRL